MFLTFVQQDVSAAVYEGRYILEDRYFRKLALLYVYTYCTKVRKYFRTSVRKYEGTFVRKYFRKYIRTSSPYNMYQYLRS